MVKIIQGKRREYLRMFPREKEEIMEGNLNVSKYQTLTTHVCICAFSKQKYGHMQCTEKQRVI